MLTRRAFFSSIRFFAVHFSRAPRDVLGDVVAGDRDVGWHQVGDRRIAAAEHHVLARRFEVVVGDRERARAVPAADRLRVLPDQLDVGDVRAGDRRRGAVQRDAALLALVRIAVNVEAIDDQIVRRLRDRGLRARSVAERDQIAATIALHFEEEQPPVVRAGRGLDRRAAAARTDDCERTGVGGRHPRAVTGQATVAFGAHGNHRAATRALRRQRERAGECRPRRERDRVARRRVVESLLKVATRRDRDRRRANRRRVQQDRDTHAHRDQRFIHEGCAYGWANALPCELIWNTRRQSCADRC